MSFLVFVVAFLFSSYQGQIYTLLWNTNNNCTGNPDTQVVVDSGSCSDITAASIYAECRGDGASRTIYQKYCDGNRDCSSNCTETEALASLSYCVCSADRCTAVRCGDAGVVDTPTVTKRAVIGGKILNFYYIISAKYERSAGEADGNVIAAGMGAYLGFPVKTFAYVKGSVDVTTYSADYSKINAEASGAALTEVVSYLGEYCEVNGVDGYQPGSDDYVINYFWAPQGAPYTTDGGSYPDANGNTIFYSSVQSNGGEFNHSCRVFQVPTEKDGRMVSPYGTKCDVTIDYTNLWSTNVTAIRGCADNKRFVGLAVDYAAAAFDIDVSVEGALNRGSRDSVDAEKISFNDGKLTHKWDNFHYVGVNRNSIDLGRRVAVRATFLEDVAEKDQINVTGTAVGALRVKRVYFVMGAKSDGNVFYWDPTATVTDPAVNPDQGGSDYGWIAAIVIIGILVILVIGVAAFFLTRKKDSEHV